MIEPTPIQKCIACATGFGMACFAFFFAAIVLVPITGTISESLGLPDAIPIVLIMLQLFGLPVVAAIVGVSTAAQSIVASTNRDQQSSHRS